MSDVNIQTFSGKVNVSNNFTVGSGHLFVDTQNNKVGLNTNTPEANLHVTGNTYISTDISVGGTLTMGTVTVEALHSLDAVTSVGNTTPHTVEFQNTDTSLVASGNVQANYFIGNGSELSNISLQQVTDAGNTTSNTLLLTNTDTSLVASGNVGVGTTSPLTPLHISSANEITTSPAGSAVSQMRFGSTNSTVLFGVSSTAGHISAYDTSNFNTNRNLCFNADGGNVGIGTTSPGSLLSIESTSGNHLRLNYNNDYYNVIERDSSGNLIFSEKRGAGATLTPHITMLSNSGKVGIGTSSPEGALHVAVDSADGNTSDNALIIGGPTNCTGNTNLRIGCHNDYAWIQSHCGEPLRLNPMGNQVQYGTSNTVLSDDRIKDNEMYIENATDTLLKLKPQIYDKKLAWNISELNEIVNVVREGGLITQDVWYDAPELRHLVVLGKDASPTTDKPFTDNDPQNDPDYSSWGDQASTLNYTGLISYLIKSNQELHARIQALENAS